MLMTVHRTPSFVRALRFLSALAVVGITGAALAQTGTRLIRLGGKLANPYGVAVDGSGNVYVADQGHSAVKEIPPNCSSSTCVITLGGGFDQPWGVAVDGSGNVYVADTVNSAVKEMPAGCAAATCVTPLGGGFSNPTGVAVDGSGNVYVADGGSGFVKEIPVGCTSSTCMISLGGGGDFASPTAVAVDGSGNVYLAGYNSGGGGVYEIPPGCTSSSCDMILELAARPTGIAVDGNGNVFVSNASTDTVTARPQSCLADYACQVPLGGAFSNPWGVAVDNSGNVYVPDSYDGTIHELVGAGLIFGSFGAPLDSSSMITQILPGDDVLINGWAAYPQQGGPVSKVTVLLDGTAAGDATLAVPKPTLEFEDHNPSYYEAGWTFTVPASGLAAGTHHTVGAIAYTSLGVPVSLAAQGFTVATARVGEAPIGYIEEAVDATTHSTTVAQSDSLYVQGWAAAVPGGFPLSKVVICLYDQANPLGDATLGLPRPGIAAEYGNPAFANSGWEFTVPAASLPLGTQFIAAYGYYTVGNTGEYAYLGTQVINVTATPVNAPPFGSLGEAVDATTQSTTVAQGDNLLVQGWAADPQQGAPVSTVTILIDGTAVGNATLGLARPGVAATYHNSAYLNSGWTFTAPASGLAAGTHEVTVVAYDSLGLSNQIGTAFITVTD
jgi:streptogramin lyase